MARQERARPLPKFGEWDAGNPASAEGFTVIFSKARDEKKATGTVAGGPAGQRRMNNNLSAPPEPPQQQKKQQRERERERPPSPSKKWFCCF